MFRKIEKSEKGSLALEQVLFIGAVVLISGGLFAFYGNLGDYFASVNIESVPSEIDVSN